MKLHCAILDDYQNIALDIVDWSSLGDQVEIVTFTQHISDEQQLVKLLADKEIIIIMRERTPFKRSLLEKLPKLKLLITTGPSNAAIDLDAATEYGIIVCATGGKSEPAVELTWGLILGLLRHIPEENNIFKASGPWQSTIGVGLQNKQLGLLGLGRTGSLMVPIANAFGMQVMAFSEHLTTEKTNVLGVSLAPSKQALLENSDIVSIHLVLSDRTHHLIKRDDLKHMRPTSYLVNTSRAQIVDSEALIEALENKWIAGAGLDVFDIEPLPARDILRRLPNVLATPHLGYVTIENYKIFYEHAIENIHGYLQNEPKRLLNPGVKR